MKCRCSNCGWLEVNQSGAMFCGYSDERTWKNESCPAWKDKDEPQTNADRLRSMSDEELAEWILREPTIGCFAICPPGTKAGGDCPTSPCEQCWLDWLKAPVEVDNG